MKLPYAGTAGVALLLLGGFFFTAQSPALSDPPPGKGHGKHAVPFKHVIVIFQENRTPDNLFQGLCVAPYGSASSCSTSAVAGKYDIQTHGWNNAGTPVDPVTVPLDNQYDLDHGHSGFVAMCDSGGTTTCKMDGAGSVKCFHVCPSPLPQFRYVDNTTGTVNPYLELATQYGWGNLMFQTNQGPSYPAHQYMFGGTSAPSAADDAAGIFASENMQGTGGVGGSQVLAGCVAGPKTRVKLMTPSGETGTIYPCFEHQTMGDLLKPPLTWRYYSPIEGTIWSAPNSIRHICKPTAALPHHCVGSIWNTHEDLRVAGVLEDILTCKLRNVSWVIPTGQNSDHANAGDNGGPSWVASIVNAIGNDSSCDGGGYWNDTAIVITWDDWGGWYDHVAPTFAPTPQGDYEHGFRVPLVVVSAYTPKGYINNVPHDFGTVLRFIEENFALGEGALGFADKRASGDLTAFFDTSKHPRKFKTITTTKSLEFFRRDRRKPRPPDPM